jgi:glutamate 5-kinase
MVQHLSGKAIVSVGVNYKVINNLASCAVELKRLGYNVVIVSSGAMGLGVSKLGPDKLKSKLEELSDNPAITSFKQALTAIGQIDLMNAYENVFRFHDIHVGQLLITHTGLDDNNQNPSIKNTLEKLFALDVIPVINANDPITSSEIEYGDNDSLAARIAILIKAERLFILSDANGLYDSDPRSNPEAKLMPIVEKIDDYVRSIAGESQSTAGLGGMKSKIAAAAICTENGTAVDIVGINQIAKIPDYINGKKEITGTYFAAH